MGRYLTVLYKNTQTDYTYDEDFYGKYQNIDLDTYNEWNGSVDDLILLALFESHRVCIKKDTKRIKILSILWMIIEEATNGFDYITIHNI